MAKKRFVTIKLPASNLILAICVFVLLVLLFFVYNHAVLDKERYINSTLTNQYLSKFKCWYGVFNTTCYTLAEKECGKKPNHPEYGITRSGLRAVAGRTVAVDNSVVKRGSVLIDIETGRKYIADDTGSGVKGHHVDIFVGEGTKANVTQAQKYGMQRRGFLVIE